MSIVEIKGGRLTYRYLKNKSKDDLAHMVLRQLDDIEILSGEILRCHGGYISGSDGAPCDCKACLIARGYIQ